MDQTIATHIVVTPARNEADNLRRLGASLIAQTWHPDAWIVVDNGSTDETVEVVSALGREHDWIKILSIEGSAQPARGTASIRAFNAGVASSPLQADLISNVDADISFPPDYFEEVRNAFEHQPKLGITSGTCYEPSGDEWLPVHVTFTNLRGGARTYRAECIAQLMPLEERVGWDGIDSIRANVRGWDTTAIPALSYFHHRPTREREPNQFMAWADEGDLSYYMWYRPSYLLLRTVYHAALRREPAAAGLLHGYARSFLRRAPRHSDPGFRELVHRLQGLRSLPARIAELRGRGTGQASSGGDASLGST